MGSVRRQTHAQEVHSGQSKTEPTVGSLGVKIVIINNFYSDTVSSNHTSILQYLFIFYLNSPVCGLEWTCYINMQERDEKCKSL